MKVKFKINKTLTASEEMEMNGFVSSLEKTYLADINRDERMLFTIFDFTTDWKNYQSVINFIKQRCKGKPYLTVL